MDHLVDQIKIKSHYTGSKLASNPHVGGVPITHAMLGRISKDRAGISDAKAFPTPEAPSGGRQDFREVKEQAGKVSIRPDLPSPACRGNRPLWTSATSFKVQKALITSRIMR